MSPNAEITQVREAQITYQSTGISLPIERTATPESAAAYFRAALPTDDPREHFAVLALDTKHNVIGHYLLGIGTIDAALVHPREVYRFALLATV